ncbi:MAG: carbohydrate-binding domain-containing protein [Bacteroidales bacterium]|nr:carbohydrate-binding domain-containing protein [Bacteroidales bacterium]
MSNREFIFLLTAAFVLSMFIACDDKLEPVLYNYEQVSESTDDDTEVDNSAYYEGTVADALAANCKDHEDAGDYNWDNAEVINIVLNGSSITVDRAGAIVDGSKVTIISAGTYNISGSLADGQVIVNTEDEEIVRLILNGVDIYSSASAAIYIMNAQKTVIVLADYSENYITDGNNYVFENAEEDEPNAAVFSKDDLTVCGNGTLVVNGNYNDGIASKDGMIINGGTIHVSAADDGIRGKDYLVVEEGNITVEAGGDGLKSDNDEDSTKGYVYIEYAEIGIVAEGDAIVAETDVLIADGDFVLISGGGSNYYVNSSTSAKGIKAVVNTIIDGGVFSVNSADDALHSNGNLSVNGGSYNISTGDDGIHGDEIITISGGEINISASYEGVESKIITINNGYLLIHSNDDGINVTEGGGSEPPGGPNPGGYSTSGDYCLYINGGHTVVYTGGDGIDINGFVVMAGGSLIVHGPTSDMNAALDYDASFKLTGGLLIAAGSAGMAMSPGTASTQNSLLLNFNSKMQAETLFHIQSNEGDEIVSFLPAKNYQSVVFSSPALIMNSGYDVYYGGSSTGSVNDGLYENGSYTPGTKYTSFTISGVVTKIGNTGNPGGR